MLHVAWGPKFQSGPRYVASRFFPDTDRASELSFQCLASRKLVLEEAALRTCKATVTSQSPPGFTSCSQRRLIKEKGAQNAE